MARTFARFRTVCVQDFSKTLSVHLAGNGYTNSTLFKTGDSEGSEEERSGALTQRYGCYFNLALK